MSSKEYAVGRAAQIEEFLAARGFSLAWDQDRVTVKKDGYLVTAAIKENSALGRLRAIVYVTRALGIGNS